MKECYFCDETECLEKHHIVPRRYDGSNREHNLVKVCPTCHQKLERLYDKRFYQKLKDQMIINLSKSKEEIRERRDAMLEFWKVSGKPKESRFAGAALALDWVLEKTVAENKVLKEHKDRNFRALFNQENNGLR